MQKQTLKQIRNVKKKLTFVTKLTKQSSQLKDYQETEGKGFDAERDAAQAALDDLKKAQEDNNLDDMKANLKHWTKKLKDLLWNSTNKPQQRNKLKQEQKARKQQETQAMTS